MSLFRFRVYWEEDDQVYRDIEIRTTQTLFQFHEAILKAFEFDGKHPATFYESNDRGERFRRFDSDVLVNKKDAIALSMIKAPLSALVSLPNQKFIYIYNMPKKQWAFLVEMIGVSKDEDIKKNYPICSRKEGIAPIQFGAKGVLGDRLETISSMTSLPKIWLRVLAVRAKAPARLPVNHLAALTSKINSQCYDHPF